MHKKNNKHRFTELDVFRGIAIIFVLLFHYTTRYDQIYGHPEMIFSFPFGKFGVQFFFMLSGFVIYMSLENINSNYDFIVNRLSRLYPAYWVSVIITFSAVYIFTLPGREVTLSNAILNLTMMQDWISSRYVVNIKHVDGAYWTLSRFISFYFIIFLINKFNAKSKIHLICFIWILAICSIKLCSQFGINIPGKIILTLLLKDGSFFIIGIMFFMIKKHGYKTSTITIMFLSLVAIYFVNGKNLFIFATLFSILFFLAIKNYLLFINIKPLINIGSISYSLYLLHQNIGYIIIRELYKYEINFIFIILIPTVITILLATFITFYIEKPTMKLIRSRLNK